MKKAYYKSNSSPLLCKIINKNAVIILSNFRSNRSIDFIKGAGMANYAKAGMEKTTKEEFDNAYSKIIDFLNTKL